MKIREYALSGLVLLGSIPANAQEKQYCNLPQSVQTRYVQEHKGSRGTTYLVGGMHYNRVLERDARVMTELVASGSIDAFLMESRDFGELDWFDAEIRYGFMNPFSSALKKNNIPVFGFEHNEIYTRGSEFFRGFDLRRTILFYEESIGSLEKIDATGARSRLFKEQFSEDIGEYRSKLKTLSQKYTVDDFTWDIVKPKVHDEREFYAVDAADEYLVSRFPRLALNWGKDHNKGFIDMFGQRGYTVCVAELDDIMMDRERIEMRNREEPMVITLFDMVAKSVYGMAKFRAQTEFGNPTDWYDLLGPFYKEPELKTKKLQ